MNMKGMIWSQYDFQSIPYQLLYRLHFLACSVEATTVVDDAAGAANVSTVDAVGVGAIGAGVLGIGMATLVFLTASKILSSTMSSKSLVTML